MNEEMIQKYQEEQKKVHDLLKEIKKKTTGNKIKNINWATVGSMIHIKERLEDINQHFFAKI